MRPLACIAVLVLALAGCGGGSSSADDVVAETAEKLGEIESGDLRLRLVAARTGEPAEDVGIELAGPFAFAEAEDELPLAKIDFTETGGASEAAAVFVSTRERAFVSLAGRTYELPPALVADLRGLGAGEDGGFEALDIRDWLVDPEVSDGGTVDGDETDRVQAGLDVVRAVNDVVELMRALGVTDAEPIGDESGEQLERAVRSSRVVVVTGKDDRLLRRLTLEVAFGVTTPPALEQALHLLGGGGKLTFDLRIGNPNEPVTVEAPTDAEPYPTG